MSKEERLAEYVLLCNELDQDIIRLARPTVLDAREHLDYWITKAREQSILSRTSIRQVILEARRAIREPRVSTKGISKDPAKDNRDAKRIQKLMDQGITSTRQLELTAHIAVSRVRRLIKQYQLKPIQPATYTGV